MRPLWPFLWSCVAGAEGVGRKKVTNGHTRTRSRSTATFPGATSRSPGNTTANGTRSCTWASKTTTARRAARPLSGWTCVPPPPLQTLFGVLTGEGGNAGAAKTPARRRGPDVFPATQSGRPDPARLRTRPERCRRIVVLGGGLLIPRPRPHSLQQQRFVRHATRDHGRFPRFHSTCQIRLATYLRSPCVCLVSVFCGVRASHTPIRPQPLVVALRKQSLLATNRWK